MKTSYDIELDAVGAATPEVYTLARDKRGTPAISLGEVPNEPGPSNQIGTIVIPNFTGGFGQLLDSDSTKYLYSQKAFLTQPTHMAAMTYTPVTFGGAPINGGFTSTSNNNFGAASFVPISDTLWMVIVPNKIYSFDPSTADSFADTTADTGYGLLATEYFTGSWAKHGTDIYFGVADSSHVSQNMCFWPISTDPTAGWGEVDDSGWSGNGSSKASYMHSFGNKIWWVANQSAAPHKAYWTDEDLNGIDPTVRGPFDIQSEARVTNIHILGAYMIYFVNDGTINAIDTDGVFAPLVTDSILSTSGVDNLFGFGAIVYTDGLLVPSATGLLKLTVGSIQNISAYKFNPWQNDVMPTNQKPGFGVKAIANSEEEIFIATDGSSTNQSVIFHVMQTSLESFAYHPLFVPSTNANDEVRAIAIFTLPGQLQRVVYYVINDGNVQVVVIPDPSISDSISASGEAGLVRTSLLGMAQGGTTKRFIRLRGNLQQSASKSFGASFKVDGVGDDSLTSLGSNITTEGPWSFNFPTTSASLGRAVQIEFSLGGKEQVQFPIYIDYEFAPSRDDFIRFRLVASSTPSGKQGVQSRKTQTRDGIIDAISALKGIHATLKFRDTNKTWTVVVESYEAADTSDDIVLNQGESTVEVLCRRIA